MNAPAVIPCGLGVDRLIRVRGTVQGVGFRPFVQRTAERLGLAGWVLNDDNGVLIRAVGTAEAVDRLLHALGAGSPPASRIEDIEVSEGPAGPAVPGSFAIVESRSDGGGAQAGIPADLALCAECRAELLSPSDRRHGYAFINCTQCGPRYSIIKALPYDRPRTTMAAFAMCPACSAEYHDPSDRRFHAQPNACPVCGPRLSLRGPGGDLLAEGDQALEGAVRELGRGAIVAVKGIGGFHLMCDASDESAVARLRQRKHREEKPFAVMFPTREALLLAARVPDYAAEALASPSAPVVLVERMPSDGLARGVAPGNPWIGALLPYSPVHVLLMGRFGRPLVATSANLSEEPLCTDDDEAVRRLAGITDFLLGHNRGIERPVDDSVLRFTEGGAPILLRRARGHAPSPLRLPGRLDAPLLCVGAHMKNTVAVASGSRVVLSPHIGDLGNAVTHEAFVHTVEMLRDLHGASFGAVAHDKHPDYASTHYARSTGLRCTGVQHHLAHVLACLLEHRHPAEGVLGVSWDGTGYGEDGTIWGGEFITVGGGAARRVARLRPFRLPGGEAAVRDGRRVALSLASDSGTPEGFSSLASRLGLKHSDAGILEAMLAGGVNSPVCSSAGRLFDATAALLGLGPRNSFEGQLPLALEAAAKRGLGRGGRMSFPFNPSAGTGGVGEIDWRPALGGLLSGCDDPEAKAAAFHRGLSEAIAEVAAHVGLATVALTGGCFQNALLLGLTRDALEQRGMRVLAHRVLAPNDGSIAAGQALGVLLNLTDVQLH